LGIRIASTPDVAVAADVLTQHYNNGRTGATLDESILNTTKLSSGKFEKLWTLYADGQVVAQPLYGFVDRYHRQSWCAGRQRKI